jgi:NADH-quinone oxidoreductase subunit L
VSTAMLLTLLFIVFVYLFAVESFTSFLYPDPEEVASYFRAADLPDWLFDLIVVMSALVTILGWVYLYMSAHGRAVWMPTWIDGLRTRLYAVFLNRMYADEFYQLIGLMTAQLIHRIDKLERGWSR